MRKIGKAHLEGLLEGTPYWSEKGKDGSRTTSRDAARELAAVWFSERAPVGQHRL